MRFNNGTFAETIRKEVFSFHWGCSADWKRSWNCWRPSHRTKAIEKGLAWEWKVTEESKGKRQWWPLNSRIQPCLTSVPWTFQYCKPTNTLWCRFLSLVTKTYLMIQCYAAIWVLIRIKWAKDICNMWLIGGPLKISSEEFFFSSPPSEYSSNIKCTKCIKQFRASMDGAWL